LGALDDWCSRKTDERFSRLSSLGVIEGERGP